MGCEEKMIRIGEHQLYNESVENFHPQLRKKALILYTDPPWSDSNIKYWTTLNKKATGRDMKALSYTELLSEIKRIIKNYVDGYVCIEGSIHNEVFPTFFNDTLYNVKIYKVYYKTGKGYLPNLILCGVTNPKYSFDLDLEGTKCNGFTLPNKVISRLKRDGEIVIDPFCGLGNTARATLKNGMVFVGNEFNIERLKKTIEVIRKWES